MLYPVRQNERKWKAMAGNGTTRNREKTLAQHGKPLIYNKPVFAVAPMIDGIDR